MLGIRCGDPHRMANLLGYSRRTPYNAAMYSHFSPSSYICTISRRCVLVSLWVIFRRTRCCLRWICIYLLVSVLFWPFRLLLLVSIAFLHWCEQYSLLGSRVINSTLHFRHVGFNNFHFTLPCLSFFRKLEYGMWGIIISNSLCGRGGPPVGVGGMRCTPSIPHPTAARRTVRRGAA